MLKCNMIPLVLITKNIKDAKKYLLDKKIINKNSLFFEILPEKKEYSINEIKNLWSETKIFNKSKRIYFLANFQLSSLEAQNAFLKLLEEPPKNVLFVLTADNQNKLLSTIISRVKIINFKNKSEIINNTNKNKEKLLEQFIKNKNSFNFISKDEISIDDIIIFFRKKLKEENNKNYSFILNETLKIKNLLENNNLNNQLALDHLFIYIKKLLKL